MCGRYTNTQGPEELNDRFRVPISTTEGTHRYNIAPTENVLAIVSPKGTPEARVLRWGLVPHWAERSEVLGQDDQRARGDASPHAPPTAT